MKRGGPLKRKAPLKRGGPLKRKAPIRRNVRPEMKRTKLKPRRKSRQHGKGPRAVENTQAFRQAAVAQRVCAICGAASRRFDAKLGWVLLPFDAHHVIEKRYLKRNHYPMYDPENALRLCEDCHGAHTVGSKKVPLTALLDRNIRYAFYLLGPRAYDYLRRHYDGEDPRVELALQEEELKAL